LNEADTLAICIDKANSAMALHKINGEVIVADNGSTDDSVKIAEVHSARVVPVKEKGYGNALLGGIAAAQGKYIVMGDADDSYDFLEIPRFVDKLREGYDLVQGCRLPSGGGHLEDGAMPWSHRLIGNPLFSWMARHWFGAPIHDVYCGLRGFRKDYFVSLGQRCLGMEFATEMIIKSSLYKAKIAEVPITLHKDGRKTHTSHLRTVRDGWRTLRFFLIYSPRHLFFIPGLILVMLGLVGYVIALPGLSIAGITFDAHTLLFSSLALICGFQAISLMFLTKIFAINEGLMPSSGRFDNFVISINIEKILFVASLLVLGGLVLLASAMNMWRLVDFGHLDYAETMRLVIPGATFTAIGFQVAISSFVIGMFRLKRK